MRYKDPAYRTKLVEAIEEHQDEELLSDRELSLQAWLSPTMISKIKKWTTVPKLSTLRKLKACGIVIPKPEKMVEIIPQESSESFQSNI